MHYRTKCLHRIKWYREKIAQVPPSQKESLIESIRRIKGDYRRYLQGKPTILYI
jgi:hypothetical protein